MTEATIRRGDLFWVEPDGSRGSVPGHRHPHVVLQDDVFNRSRLTTVIVCALTSNLGRANEPGNVLLDPGASPRSRGDHRCESLTCFWGGSVDPP